MQNDSLHFIFTLGTDMSESFYWFGHRIVGVLFCINFLLDCTEISLCVSRFDLEWSALIKNSWVNYFPNIRQLSHIQNAIASGPSNLPPVSHWRLCYYVILRFRKENGLPRLLIPGNYRLNIRFGHFTILFCTTEDVFFQFHLQSYHASYTYLILLFRTWKLQLRR